MNTENWLIRSLPPLKGKTVAVTGATGGLGIPVCRAFWPWAEIFCC